MTLINIRRVVFGTTEDDDGGGLREWHNGAGGLPCVCGIQIIFFYRQTGLPLGRLGLQRWWKETGGAKVSSSFFFHQV